MKLRDFLLRFAKRGWVGKGFRHRLAGHPSSQAELGIVARVLGLGAMASRFATAPDHRRN
jgi:hypothetical protein